MKTSTTISNKKAYLTLGIFSLFVAFITTYLVYTSFAVTYITHNFSISPSSGGVIKNVTGPVGAYINCGSVCSRNYEYNSTPISYQAYPNSGYKFAGWESSPSIRDGYDYTTNPLNVSRVRNWNFQAVFVRTSEIEEANQVLQKYINACPILAGTTVTFGATPEGYQAVSYYQSARILISPTHTASIERLIGHEIYHIDDWKDNGVINWGENVPPTPKPSCFANAGL